MVRRFVMCLFGMCLAALLAAAVVAVAVPANALDPATNAGSDVPPPAWPSSPFREVVDGVTGLPIPQLCRAGGQTFQLGDTVCMHTHRGVQLARCDLLLNNTTWVPIGIACSMQPGR
jgi:hypothetical protein